MLRYIPPLLIALLVCLTLDVWETLAYGFVVAPFAFFWSACPCCDGNCTIFTDDFSTDRTGTDYTTIAGSWSVDSGVLSTSSASALILSDTAYDGAATGVHTTAIITLPATSDKGRMYFGYVDSNTHWYLEVSPGAGIFGSPVNGTLKLFEVSGGTPTQRGSTQTVESYTLSEPLRVCASFGDGYVEVSAQQTGAVAFISHTATPTAASTKCGLGTGSGTTSATLDDFFIYENRLDDGTCRECSPDCGRFCTDGMPTTIEVTLPTFGDDQCDCDDLLSGNTFVLTKQTDGHGNDTLGDPSGNTGYPDVSDYCCYRYTQLECLCVGGGGEGHDVVISAWVMPTGPGGSSYVWRVRVAVVAIELGVVGQYWNTYWWELGSLSAVECGGNTWNLPFLIHLTNGGGGGLDPCDPTPTTGDVTVAV